MIVAGTDIRSVVSIIVVEVVAVVVVVVLGFSFESSFGRRSSVTKMGRAIGVATRDENKNARQ